MKKYLVDVVITNKETREMKFIEETINNEREAYNRREEILNNMPKTHYSHWAKIHTVVKCHCGEEIICSNFTNTCDKCEADYNHSGELLVSRSLWGEETGEHWTECY
jgi:hypothetical protein